MSSVYQQRWVCKFCSKSFIHEDRYLAHKCDAMKKLDELETPDGQAALNYYQQWMRAYKRLPPPASTFTTSKYFRTFVKFAEFVRKVRMPYVDKFIWLMKEKDISPTIWTNDEVYSLFLEFVDHKTTPMEQLKTSVDTILKYADRKEIEVSQVFQVMDPNELIVLVRTRQLSPWLLLFSKQFKKMLSERTSPEQKVIIETIIRPDFWVKRIQENQSHTESIKMCLQEMNL